LELKGEFSGGFTIAGLEVGCGFGAEFGFFAIELLGFRDEFLDEPGVAGEAFIELGNLLAEVFFFVFEKSFGIALFDTADEEAEKAFD
jgi:hypothetical protein